MRHAEEELHVLNQNLIQDMNDNQSQAFQIDEERVEAIGSLERAHQELKGEQVQDDQQTKRLESARDEISTEIASKTTKVESEVEDLKTKIHEVDGQLKETQEEKNRNVEEGRKLQDVIDIEEDLQEKGLSQEAKDLRNENETLQKQFQQSASILVSERDERDQMLDDHKNLCQEYDSQIQVFFSKLFQTEESRKIHGDHRNEIMHKVKILENQGDFLEQKIQISEIDLDAFKTELELLRTDYSLDEQVFNEQIQELRGSISEQNTEISDLRDRLNQVECQRKSLDLKVEKQKLDLGSYEKEIEEIENLGYDQQVTDLQGRLKTVENQRRQHQDDLEKAQTNLTSKLTLFEGLEGRRNKEREDHAQRIESEIMKIANLQMTINDILRSLDELESKLASDGNKDIVGAALENERDSLTLKLKWALEERDNSRNDIKEAIELLKAKQAEATEQERQIQILQKEIREVIALVTEKKTIITELELEIEKCDERIEFLVIRIRELDNEIHELTIILDQREMRLRELNEIIGRPQPVEVHYKAVKGDEVDEMLAQYLENCPVPVKRLGGGFYIFGTRKIYAKIMNGKLVVRVGGGYMFISEFIATYSEPEIAKLTKIASNLGVESIWDLDLEELFFNKGGASPKTSALDKSPRGGIGVGSFKKSKKGKTGNFAMNGSKRPKTFKGGF